MERVGSNMLGCSIIVGDIVNTDVNVALFLIPSDLVVGRCKSSRGLVWRERVGGESGWYHTNPILDYGTFHG